MKYLDELVDKLKHYSNLAAEICVNNYLPCPAMSSIFKNKRIIEVNQYLIPDNLEITAHIMSHEFGHHYLDHVLTDPRTLHQLELDIIEDEADTYASIFIEKYGYNKQPIIDFIIKSNTNYHNRIKILNNTL